MSTDRQALPADSFQRWTCGSDSDEELEYYVWPREEDDFDRAVVYIHGLVSDLSWFRIPSELPDRTAIVFLPRQPREHVEDFVSWRDHYARCIEHFRDHHQCQFLHLVAQCFGTMPAMHLAVTRPETFDSITLACPPDRLRKEFSIRKKLGILFGSPRDEVHCELTPGSYGRLPSLKRFITQNERVRWTFTNAFYRQTNALRSWLRRNVICYPAPTHQILASEDAVAVPVPNWIDALRKDVPQQITSIQSDHFCELLPSRREFWRKVLDFQLQHEPKFEFSGEAHSVLVTGATGFLGDHVVHRLHQDGRRVVALARDVDKATRQFEQLDRVEVRKGCLEDLEALETALSGVDVVVHLAGHVSDWDRWEEFVKANVEGTRNLLFTAHAQGVRQFIHISSLGVFGDTDQDHFDENNMYRLSSDDYSNSKIYAEIAVRNYCRDHVLPFSIIRPGFVYGDGDRKFLPRLIERIRSGKFRYVGTPKNFVNTVYVGNVAALIAAAVGNPDALGQTYNIADPQDTTIQQFNERVCDVLGMPSPEKVVSKPVVLRVATVLESVFRALRLRSPPPITRKQVNFVARSRSVDSRKAWALIGSQPFSFEDGMARTLEALQKS